MASAPTQEMLAMTKAKIADELRNSRPLNLYLRSRGHSFGRLCEKVVALLRAKKDLYQRVPKNAEPMVNAVWLLLLNLLYVRYSDPSRYVAVSMRVTVRRHGFGYRPFRRVLTALCELGYITKHRGYWNKVTGKGYCTRIRATAQLSALATGYGIRPHMIEQKGPHRTLEMRWGKDRGKKPRRWPRDPDSQALKATMKANLKRINQALSESFIGLHVPDDTLHEINRELRAKGSRTFGSLISVARPRPEASWVDFYRKGLFRIFNDGSTSFGGRFYGGWWAAIPRTYRKHIHIATHYDFPMWTVECDYSSMHPRLAYAEAGVQPPEDCYHIPEVPRGQEQREYIKTALLVLLNASTRDAAIRAVRRTLSEDFSEWWRNNRPGETRPKMTEEQLVPIGCPGIQDLLTLIERAHEPITSCLGTDAGKRLMNTDSRIAERVMLRMIDAGSIALPVHDSFLVPKGEQGHLRQVMQESFQEVTGTQSQITEDETELDTYRREVGDKGEDPLGDLVATQVEEDHRYSVYYDLRRDWMDQMRTRWHRAQNQPHRT